MALIKGTDREETPDPSAALPCQAKIGGPPPALTVSDADAKWSISPLGFETVNVPVCAVFVVVMVSVDEPDPVTLGGLKVPVAPDGRSLTLNLTVRQIRSSV
jgi:hypothetical protein